MMVIKHDVDARRAESGIHSYQGVGIMLNSEASFSSPKARQYMIRLCKHFGHKVPAEWSDSEGQVTFEMGTCAMRAGDHLLTLVCSAEHETALQSVELTIEDHLKRFARREEASLQWSRVKA